MNPMLGQMTPFLVMEVLEEAQKLERQGVDVIHLEVGEPDFDMPECAVSAAAAAGTQGHTHYTHSLGDRGLREALARFYGVEYGVEVDPDCIVITSGSSPAILLTLQVLCGCGDEVILSNPGYPCYRNFALACNAVPKEVKITAANGFQYDPAAIRAAITPRTRAVFVNSPMNPTGVLMKDSVFKELAELGVPLVSDEIYHGLVYEGRARCALEFTNDTFVLNGFSKRFAMTGLRLGYLIAPKQYIRPLQILQQNLFICASSTAQKAGIAVLEHGAEVVEAMRRTYDERRLYLLKRLRAMGFVIRQDPMGAFYILADARRFTTDSYAFAFDVLRKAGVGITPGVDFGTEGEGFVRFSYANKLERIAEAMNRLEKYLSGLKA